MNLARIHSKPNLYIKSLEKAILDTAGTFLLRGWKQIEKENVEIVDDTVLPEILRIQAEGFEKKRRGEIIKDSNKFRNIFYVIKSQNKVVGYCIYHLKPTFSRRGFEKKAVIYSIAIDRKFRSKGFGKRLLEESIREMKLNSVLTVFLYVNVNNTPAIKLYEKTGFLVVKEVENLCGQNERCYKMELKLF
ncbi:GNAT family N-acetyltransferase [Methanosarcina sp. DH2]|jgi:ribosomal-protein-alanine N-acetyltransferase|uniref:GNAT family N-acetyltransferase n=1 Tax=Methanosarcina sp. DH2 TaxID=2605639 RepID=UPI001E475A81|nr:N-acetyltransferase [Methanosarcina sp. DH2]MCC4770729.1 GNAT family N-acetyltransferase [Methanosarcina sp. DH2]